MFVRVFDFLKPTMNWDVYKHIQKIVLTNIELYEQGLIPVNKLLGKGIIHTSYIKTSIQNHYGIKQFTHDTNDVITYIDSEQYPLSNNRMHIYLCISNRPTMGTLAFQTYLSYIRQEYPHIEKISLDSIDNNQTIRFYNKLGFTETNDYLSMFSSSFVPMHLNLK